MQVTHDEESTHIPVLFDVFTDESFNEQLIRLSASSADLEAL